MTEWGDIPYRSERLFESLMDENPELKLFLFSPSAMAIDFAAKAFPGVRPETKLEDTALSISANTFRVFAATRANDGWVPFHYGCPRCACCCRQRDAHSSLATPKQRAQEPKSHAVGRDHAMTNARNTLEMAKTEPAIAVTGIAKRYGSAFALTDVSFAVDGGSSLALWVERRRQNDHIALPARIGSFHGNHPHPRNRSQRSGKQSRGKIGFVPQDLPISPLTVSEMTTFVANLKHAPVRSTENSTCWELAISSTNRLAPCQEA